MNSIKARCTALNIVITSVHACSNPVTSAADRRCSVKDEPIANDTALQAGAHAIARQVINSKLSTFQYRRSPGRWASLRDSSRAFSTGARSQGWGRLLIVYRR